MSHYEDDGGMDRPEALPPSLRAAVDALREVCPYTHLTLPTICSV